MARKLTVVVSQGQSANPIKKKMEEDIVTQLLFEPGVEVTVIPNLYDLAPDGTGMLCLQGISGDLVVLSWLFPRAAFWILNRNGIRGKIGQSLIVEAAEESDDEDAGDHDADDEGDDSESASEVASVEAEKPPLEPVPNRQIYCIDLRLRNDANEYLNEVRRIKKEQSTQTVELMGWIQGTPQPEQLARYISNGNGDNKSPSMENGGVANHLVPLPGTSINGSVPDLGGVMGQSLPVAASPAGDSSPNRIEEETNRRWYPVIDFSRCTNCMECIDFCLFGVYGLDRAEQILVEQPDNCRKGCPACSRVCPENAIIFPQHKSPAIAGSANESAGGFKIDLSRLFGAPDALEQAVLERDVELVAVGRDAVGMNVGIPKRQTQDAPRPKDDLDHLLDKLDELDL